MSNVTNEISIILGQAIKAARKEKGLTMQHLSQEVGLSQSAISMIENGLRQPSLQTLAKFSQTLEVDFSKYLLDSPVLPSPNIQQRLPSAQTIHIETIDFHAQFNLTNFQCAYSDPDIQQAIFTSFATYLNEKLQSDMIQQELNDIMKQTIQETLSKKQPELQKLYNRIQE